MQSKRPIIVLRFSAMGDVVMAASVLREFRQQHPDVPVVMVSRELFRPFFDDIANLKFHTFNPKTTHRGIRGLHRLYQELLAYGPGAIADLHANLRSRLLCAFFRANAYPIQRIDKGRKEKAALIRSRNKILKPLRRTVERYADVLRALGYPIILHYRLQRRPLPLPQTAMHYFADQHSPKIGISPFAQHPYKVYPIPKMEEVISSLAKAGCTIFIFGGGASEKAVAQDWAKKYPKVYNLIGNFTIHQEMEIISNLDIMLSMDSAGMHLASLMGIRVLSIWGPTHPYAGFLGYGQQESDCIQINHPFRPNSVYGNKPCYCDGIPCINLIEPGMIIDKFRQIGFDV
ncbi:ADP-heptose:LPS heptosyltransferase [bacterium A37T11]|nr:ADP-heptose:LPS heptosyltransferase [bacterium A37T11]